MKIKVTVAGDKEIARALRKMSDEKKREVKDEVFASGHDVRTEAIERLRDQRTWDLGNLANSIMVELENGGMISVVGPEAPYGLYVEFGTRPHFPPPDALEGWAKRHGFKSAWPICRAIAKRGLPARPFLIPAWLAVTKVFKRRVKEIAER